MFAAQLSNPRSQPPNLNSHNTRPLQAVPVIVADAFDSAALASMAQSTSVVINVAGPCECRKLPCVSLIVQPGSSSSLESVLSIASADARASCVHRVLAVCVPATLQLRAMIALHCPALPCLS